MADGIRRAGTPWRILVHWMEPADGSGDSWHVASDRTFGGGGEDRDIQAGDRTFHVRHIELPGTDFDELVVSRWCHLEQMGVGVYWLNLAGITITVTADRDGRPERVQVEGPGVNDDPVPGCVYELDWDAE